MECPPLDQQIASYLIRHPEAQDTIEGIVEWWLLEERIQVALAAVRSALTELAARGFLSVSRGRDGRIRFSLKPEKQSEVTAWLASVTASANPPRKRARKVSATPRRKSRRG